MRGALIKAGGPSIPSLTVAQREGISHFCWEASDHDLTPELVKWAHSKGLQVVIQSGPVRDGSPEALAKFLSDEITFLGAGESGKTPLSQLDVMPDNEGTHDPAWFVAFYKAFRKLRAARTIFLTVEWHQSSWFSQEMKDEISNDFRMFLLPQAYETGLMHPVDPRAVVADCTAAGLVEGDVQVFLRNDRMDIGWSGWAYNYGEAA